MEQGTIEWFETRSGKMTASNAQAIGNNGKGLETYVESLMAEKYSKNRESFSNEHTERGTELEPIARYLYELKTGNTVEQVGFIDKGTFGCSPDGLIGEDGGIEIKCLDDKNHFHVVMTEKIDSKHEWQIQMSLLVTGRKWWDYVCFNPNFERDMVIIRVFPDEEKHKKLKDGIEKGTKLINEIEKRYERE